MSEVKWQDWQPLKGQREWWKLTQLSETRNIMMKWDCTTQPLSHTYFASEKRTNLLFCKNKIMERKIFYFLTVCLSQNEDVNQLKHWTWLRLLHGFHFVRQARWYPHVSPPPGTSYLSFYIHIEIVTLSKQLARKLEEVLSACITIAQGVEYSEYYAFSSSALIQIVTKGIGVRELEKGCHMIEIQ